MPTRPTYPGVALTTDGSADAWHPVTIRPGRKGELSCTLPGGGGPVTLEVAGQEEGVSALYRTRTDPRAPPFPWPLPGEQWGRVVYPGGTVVFSRLAAGESVAEADVVAITARLIRQQELEVERAKSEAQQIPLWDPETLDDDLEDAPPGSDDGEDTEGSENESDDDDDGELDDGADEQHGELEEAYHDSYVLAQTT